MLDMDYGDNSKPKDVREECFGLDDVNKDVTGFHEQVVGRMS